MLFCLSGNSAANVWRARCPALLRAELRAAEIAEPPGGRPGAFLLALPAGMHRGRRHRVRLEERLGALLGAEVAPDAGDSPVGLFTALGAGQAGVVGGHGRVEGGDGEVQRAARMRAIARSSIVSSAWWENGSEGGSAASGIAPASYPVQLPAPVAAAGC